MAQITVNLPTLPKDWHSTLVGLLGAVGLILQQYLKTGTITYETLILAVIVAVLGYLTPAKPSVSAEQAMVATIEGVVNSALGAKLPAALTAAQATNGIVQAAADAVVAVTGAGVTVGDPQPVPGSAVST